MTCVLAKVDTKHVLYQITELLPDIDPEEQSCLTLVSEFDQIPVALDAQTVRCLSFFDCVLVLVIDDSQLLVVDISQGWSKVQLNLSLS